VEEEYLEETSTIMEVDFWFPDGEVCQRALGKCVQSLGRVQTDEITETRVQTQHTV
jgi:hypothetical protein